LTGFRCGKLAELDRAGQRGALTGARHSALGPSWTLFVNIEPKTAESTLLALVEARESVELSALGGPDDLQIIVELTERALIASQRNC
jgi:EAL domain-containing protein (putative c-di-GMP-specific phosphodiesterase class I)